MKSGKLLIVAMAIAAAAALGAAAENEEYADMVVRFQGLSPAASEDWDTAAGIEAQLRLWDSERVAIALAIGFDSWEAKEEFSEDDDGSSYVAMHVSGEASLVPVGISAVYRAPLAGGLSLVMEAGVRYVFVDSAITTEVAYEDALGSDYFVEDVEIDDAMLAVLRVGLQADLSQELSIEGGIGYQFDVGRPNETFLGEDIGSTSFKAGSAYAGLVLSF